MVVLAMDIVWKPNPRFCKIIIYHFRPRIQPVETNYTGFLKQPDKKISHMKSMLRGYITDINCKSSILHLDSRSQALCGHQILLCALLCSLYTPEQVPACFTLKKKGILNQLQCSLLQNDLMAVKWSDSILILSYC